jgi:iron complex outermembrane recepter protein
MKSRIKSIITCIALAIGVISFSIANAAVLEEIVVTAQKKDQSLQDVGIAVTAFTGNQLKQFGWSNAEKVTAMSPGVTTIQPNGPSAFFTNIRGVAQNDFSGDHQESPVAIYVDEVYVSAASGAGFQLFDYERVEILRGPQGTLFGRNATGGLVHYITRKPDQAADGYLEFTAGDYDKIKVEGAVGGALTENISGRVSFLRNEHDGVLKNRVGPNLNDGDDWAVRGQLLFEFNSNAEWLISARAGEQDVNVGPFTHESARLNPVTGLGEHFNGTDLTADGDSRIPVGYQDTDGDLFKASINVKGFNKIETSGLTSNFSMGIGDQMEFVSVTDITTLEKDYIEDSDAGPNDFFAFSLRSDIDQFSQELRLSGDRDSMSWVVGVFYLDIDGDFFNGGAASNFFAAAFPGFGLNDPSLETLGLNNPFSTDTKSTAVFAQADFDVTETLKITAGVRWSREEKEMDFKQFFSLFESPGSFNVAVEDGLGLGGAIWTFSPDEVSNEPGGPAFGFDPIVGNPKDAKLDDDLITAKLSFEWTPNNDLLMYASYNRGIKAGGFNAPIDATDFYAGIRAPEEMRFDEEVLNAYETGFKWTFADGLARLNVAAYYYDYNDYQAFALDSLTTVVFNTDAESFGAELELQASPTDGLDLLLGVGWIDNTVKDGFTQPGGRDVDREAVLTPEWNISGMARYEWSLGAGRIAAMADFNYMSSHFFQLKNSPVGEEDGYVITNARLSYTSASGKWVTSGYINNITDEDHRLMVFDLAGSPAEGGFGMNENYAGPPRWWGVSVQYIWGG